MSNWKLIRQESLFIHFCISSEACTLSSRFRHGQRSQHSLLTHWVPTPVAAFCASPLIPNDFVGNPSQPIAGVRMPAVFPHGRAKRQGARTPLPQRPKMRLQCKPFYIATSFCKELQRFPAHFWRAALLPRPPCVTPFSSLDFQISYGLPHGSVNIPLPTSFFALPPFHSTLVALPC